MSCLSILEVLTKERISVMEGSLTMSQRERERLKIIDRIKRRELTVVLAAESVGISERQMYRILKRYRLHGDNGLVHRLRETHGLIAHCTSFPNDLELLYAVLSSKPKPKSRVPHTPAPDHPWRRGNVGKARWENLHNNKNTLGSTIKNIVSSP